ncbi:MAG: 4Fe-4S binding protein, partial [Anaerolineales bacterium]|nr:4Fe-4S binding protein [Anaerolineales bacterium]
MDARQRKIYIKSMRRRWLVGKRLRQIVQYVLLLLFLYLFVSTARDGILQFPQLPIPENIFSLFNPLFALVSMIASRKIILTFIPAILLVIATIFLGRFWCGWICPLGSVLDLYGSIRRKNIPEGMRKVKYLLLAIIIVGALLGNLSLLFLDPITIFVRSLSGVFFPALANAIKPPAEGELGLVIQPVLITLFVLVLLLNIISKRFWCRYLCPLGALLGLISKISWLKRRVGEGCAKCGHCVPVCPMDAIDDELYSSDSGECIQCLNCEEKCPMAVTGLAYEWGIEASTINNPSRRQVLASATVGLAGAFALNTASVKA